MAVGLDIRIPARRWGDIERLLDSALDRDPAGWTLLLQQRCAHDVELHDAVRTLLARRDRLPGFLDRPLPRATNPGTNEPACLTGLRVGVYELVREIGWGGTAVVWLARAVNETEDCVAAKLQHSWLHTTHAQHCFQSEHRILAQLEHPNINRLIDARVTDDGLSVLLLEHVDGCAIDQHCRQQGLDLLVRLRLFLDVVRAVNFAHQQGVVHGDLKPANILVTRAGVVKLVDFGTAQRHADSSAPRDDAGPRWMTPAYASPEQLCGAAVSVQTDIYQLGVVLFELLSGQRPFHDSGSASDLARLISEHDVPPLSPVLWRPDAANPPSAVSPAEHAGQQRTLERCLDTIVQRALCRTPAGRYGSAGQLADALAVCLADG